jgi:hypothetical protein
MLGFALTLLTGLAWLLWPLLRRDPTLRFWALGLVLATIPVCGTHPEDRVLTATGLGGSALVAQVLSALAQTRLPRAPGLQRFAARALLLIHLLIAPLLLPARTLAIVSMELVLLESDDTIPHGPAAADQTVVLLNPPVDLFAVYLPAFRLSRGIDGPKQLRWLATAESPLHVARIDARTLEISPEDGFLATSSQQMFRSVTRGFGVGEQVHLSGLTLAVTSLLPDGRPATIQARFERDLEDPHYRWLRWEHHGYVPFEPPPQGTSVVLHAVDLQQLLFD